MHDAVPKHCEMHQRGCDVYADKSKQYPNQLCVYESEGPCG